MTVLLRGTVGTWCASRRVLYSSSASGRHGLENNPSWLIVGQWAVTEEGSYITGGDGSSVAQGSTGSTLPLPTNAGPPSPGAMRHSGGRRETEAERVRVPRCAGNDQQAIRRLFILFMLSDSGLNLGHDRLLVQSVGSALWGLRDPYL
ncbi:hypothetical protein GWK47_012215 [Chionoecetes opilio]|uniref:Uncharacterized protein n=1 Tax=Chionoecetes opilio TaxID=41210 RepID=A0A8J5CPJ2_CHIOP|nr:hypothetical protein GWK47_012215 [Chionoecetes opilio]